jgi:hypothetical protein
VVSEAGEPLVKTAPLPPVADKKDPNDDVAPELPAEV